MKICLCGSTRFKDRFNEINKELTLAGHVVYSCGFFGHAETDEDEPTEEQKILLDLVHLIKILESDAVFVIDVNGYIGQSTSREILWAKLTGRDIYYDSADAFHVLTQLQGIENA